MMTCAVLAMVADATPTPSQFTSAAGVLYWLSFLGANVAIVAGLFWANSRKQKREISFAPDSISRREFDMQVEANEQAHRDIFSKIGGVERGVTQRLEGKIDEMRREIPEMERRLNKSGEERTTAVHERVNEILKEVGELRGEMNRGRSDH